MKKPIPKVDFTKGSVAERVCISAKEAYNRVNEKCNDFLKTQRGIQYLLMKYPHLSLTQAILEYYCNSMIVDNYDPTCQTSL